MYFQVTTTGAVETSIQILDRHLKTYQVRHPGFDFEQRNFDWMDAWRELVRIAISKTGAHVSEVGAPWVADFVSMNSLRRFHPAEVDAVGGARAFFPAAWANVVISPSSLTPGAAPAAGAVPAAAYQPSSAPGVYALPGRMDVRLIYYWKDMLEKAGVDPAAAFTTPARIEQTLERLRAGGQAAGLQTPWIYETHVTRSWVYNMASWIWAYGGDYTDEAGLPVFDQPEAIEGMTAYFRLHRYLAPKGSGESVEQVFSQRRAAVMVMGTHYHMHLLHEEDPFLTPLETRALLPRLGAAALPGPAFVGGTSFVIWQHAPAKTTRAAIDLLTELLNAPQLTEYCYETHMLPSRVGGFAHPVVAADPFLPVLRAALETGRAHRSGRLWMPIADRLASTCKLISDELRADPTLDTRSVVERHARDLVRRLRISFSASGT